MRGKVAASVRPCIAGGRGSGGIQGVGKLSPSQKNSFREWRPLGSERGRRVGSRRTPSNRSVEGDTQDFLQPGRLFRPGGLNKYIARRLDIMDWKVL